MEKIIITLDGPAASGKSSIADKLADILNFKVLHSGLIYRAMAKNIIQNNIDINDKDSVITKAKEIHFKDLNSDELKTEIIGDTASKISIYQELRDYSNLLQRSFCDQYHKVIVEGRDAGTIVFPNANIKIFISATPKVRATRRFKELQAKGFDVIYERILCDLISRDNSDANRKIAPLKLAENSIFFDNSNLSFSESVDHLVTLIKNKLNL